MGRLSQAVRPKDGLGKPSYEKRSLDLALVQDQASYCSIVGRLSQAVRPRDGLGKPSYDKRSLDLALGRDKQRHLRRRILIATARPSG